MNFDEPPAEPLPVLREWLRVAAETDLPNPNAMTLATVDADGRPSARIVLLKGLDERGVVFFTNRRSRKGRALEANPRAALVLFWDHLNRQVIIEGAVEFAGDDESDAYFQSRPLESRIGAWASVQSTPVVSRQALEARFIEVAEQYVEGDVPRPSHWGGYRLRIERIEFWESKPARLHDRIEYVRTADGAPWRVDRLFP